MSAIHAILMRSITVADLGLVFAYIKILILAVIVLGTVMMTVAEAIVHRRRLVPIARRPCAGRDWRRAFPDASKTELREFLEIFTCSFLLPTKYLLKFRPGDRVMDIYRMMHPPGSLIDEMELEAFAMDFERTYQVNLEQLWRDDITLGDLFSRTRAA
jgi:Na+-transporting methylmalonyl-CoA/oxaloacetate decarboxylase gamma subunit